MVLLIAAANSSGLMLARASERRAEFAARAALGASRLRLVRQVVVESALAGAAGGLLGIAIVNEVFTPPAAEIDRAWRVVAAYEAALARGEGVFRLDGRMVDAPVARRARRVLARAAARAPEDPARG
jgi:citrate lyase subunit beta/citryl-CoA lyase